VGARLGEANVLQGMGNLFMANGELADAQETMDAALRLYRQIGDRYSEGRALFYFAVLAETQSELEKARSNYQSAAEVWRTIGLEDYVQRYIQPRIDNLSSKDGG
jgi:tetratricopeptide (TPR) repeat protein